MRHDNSAPIEKNGPAFILTATFLYGLGNTLTKLLYRLFPDAAAVDVVCGRFILAAVFLFVVCWITKAPLKIDRKDVPLFIVTGTGFTICVYCILTAVNHINVGTASFIQSSNTLLLCAYSVLILHETLARQKVAGLVLGIAGLACIFLSAGSLQSGSDDYKGLLLAGASALGKVTYILASQKLRKKYESIPVVMYCTMIASLLLITAARPLALIKDHVKDPAFVGLILITGIICGGVAYIFYFTAMKWTAPSTAGILNTAEQLSSSLTAMIILNETFTVRQSVGCIMVLAGVILTQMSVKRR